MLWLTKAINRFWILRIALPVGQRRPYTVNFSPETLHNFTMPEECHPREFLRAPSVVQHGPVGQSVAWPISVPRFVIVP